MSIEVFRRKEKKYFLSTEQFTTIYTAVKNNMIADAYNKGGKPYSISNIYFDTSDDELIRRSLERPVYKEKMRLRGYGVPGLSDKVFLEIKKKYKGIVGKRRTEFTLSDAYEFLRSKGTQGFQNTSNQQIVQEMQYFLNVYDLEPKTYIKYDRFAFFGKTDSDFRVTFDSNIRTRRHDIGLENGMDGDLLIDKGLWLMEVKTPTSVPFWFSELLAENSLFSTSFSKYGTEYKKQQGVEIHA